MAPKSLSECFERWVAELWGDAAERHIAIDGKTLRRSFDRALGQSPTHSEAAYATELGLVLGQVSVDAKENETDRPARTIAEITVTDAGHGRVEVRRCELSTDLSRVRRACETWPEGHGGGRSGRDRCGGRAHWRFHPQWWATAHGQV